MSAAACIAEKSSPDGSSFAPASVIWSSHTSAFQRTASRSSRAVESFQLISRSAVAWPVIHERGPIEGRAST